MDRHQYQCRDCGQLLCSQQCHQTAVAAAAGDGGGGGGGGGFHHLECRLLRGLHTELVSAGSWKWEIISVLRLLEVTTTLQSSHLADLQDHLEECRAEESWAEYSNSVISFLTSHFNTRWTRTQVERAAGILRTNAYCVEAGEQGEFGMVRIIFPLLSAMSVRQLVSQSE